MTYRAAVGVALATMLVVGCGGGRSGGAGDAGGQPPVAAVIKALGNPFFATMSQGLYEAARTHGARLRVDAAADLQDTAGQASALESLAAQRADCYVVNPIAPTNLIQPLEHIPDGTPIVNIDSPLDRTAAKAVGVGITTYIGTDNIAAGNLGADAMARSVTRGARVAVIGGIPGDVTSGDRARGFRQGAGRRFDVVQMVAADFDHDRAALAASDLLREDPRIQGFFAINDEMALGVAEAVHAAGRGGKVAVVGVDGIRPALAAVKRGAMSATVAQYPYVIGQLGVEACLARLRGRRVPAAIDAPVQLVTRANVARAQANFPKPVAPFEDPLAALLKDA
ncbi:MAG: sugar transporter substrate-binding protein [Solirubrobacterales bacterium]|nr:sugar transporter substrate-binding protein [Solirubrobacterales bacterium]